MVHAATFLAYTHIYHISYIFIFIFIYVWDGGRMYYTVRGKEDVSSFLSMCISMSLSICFLSVFLLLLLIVSARFNG